MIIGKPQPKIRSTYVPRCILTLLALALLGLAGRAQQPAATQPKPGAPTMGGSPDTPTPKLTSPTTAKPADIAKPVAQPATPPAMPKLDPKTGAPAPGIADKPVSPDEVMSKPRSTEVAELNNADPMHQGITVHGHWVINVSDPDGKQVQHHEYENSLAGTAPPLLVGLLSGYLISGDWMIALGPQSGNGACTATYQFCGLVQSAATYPGLTYCPLYYCTGSTLSVTPNFGPGGFGSGPYSLVLTGSITANQTGTIASVYTLLSTCANIGYSPTANPTSIESSSPSVCVNQTTPEPFYGPFTNANITPVSVTNGQVITVIVTLSFS